jgi:hypothetical protein
MSKYFDLNFLKIDIIFFNNNNFFDKLKSYKFRIVDLLTNEFIISILLWNECKPFLKLYTNNISSEVNFQY